MDLSQDGVLIQHDVPAVAEGDVLVAELIDLMFKLGTVQAQLTIRTSPQTPTATAFALAFTHYYPWIDWMLHPGDCTGFGSEEFDYSSIDRPPHGVGPHAAWDFSVRAAGVKVFCGTEGVIGRSEQPPSPDADVWVYSPAVGGYLQYGHVAPIADLKNGQVIHPGDLIGTVIRRDYIHIHFSVFRPMSWDARGEPVWHVGPKGLLSFQYSSDPFYYHEPTTWGYWNEGTLPSGWADHMLRVFKQYNPGIIPK